MHVWETMTCIQFVRVQKSLLNIHMIIFVGSMRQKLTSWFVQSDCFEKHCDSIADSQPCVSNPQTHELSRNAWSTMAQNVWHEQTFCVKTVRIQFLRPGGVVIRVCNNRSLCMATQALMKIHHRNSSQTISYPNPLIVSKLLSAIENKQRLQGPKTSR